MHRVELWGLSLFDIYWAPSLFRAKNIETLVGDRSKVHIIPNALTLENGGAHDVHEADPFIVVSANRFIPHKRISMLIRVFAGLKDPRAQLVLIGTGAEKEVVMAQTVARELGVEKQVLFTGRLQSPEVYQHFKTSSVYLSASLEEGFPNVFIEAMYYGLPIVATDVGGCREMIVEGKTGFLVDVMDEEALTERLRRLRDNCQLRNEHAKNFDLEQVVTQFEALYQNLIHST
jgi:glycosyltransferase involved in cell wall biosynthesis